MRTDTGQVFRLEDYHPSDYLIPATELSFRLSPDATTVVAELTIERRAGASKGAPLALDGDELTLKRVAIDGRTLPIRLPPPALGEHNGEILDPLRARDCSHTRSE